MIRRDAVQWHPSWGSTSTAGRTESGDPLRSTRPRWPACRRGRADEDVRPYQFPSLHNIPSDNALGGQLCGFQAGNTGSCWAVVGVDATLLIRWYLPVNRKPRCSLDLLLVVHRPHRRALQIDLYIPCGYGSRGSTQPSQLHPDELTLPTHMIRPDPIHQSNRFAINVYHSKAVEPVQLAGQRHPSRQSRRGTRLVIAPARV
jgi:hypothetical protein